MGGVGWGARWNFYMMCAGSSEPSLVANLISTQISYRYIRWFKFCMCLQEVKWTIVLLWEREREKIVFFYIYFYFYFI